MLHHLFLLFSLLSAPAVKPSAPSEIDQLVNGLQARYQRLTSLSMDFTQMYLAPGERLRRESGKLMLKKPGRMRWEYSSPETKLYLSDGEIVFEYIPAQRTATRMKIKESSDARTPFLFLLGRGNLRRDFKRIEFSAESPVQAGNRVLRLTPKRTADFREIALEIVPASFQIARLSFTDANGARSDFLFSNIQENSASDDSLFTFKVPAGVQVIER
jgi:outer membrane lipoprotein carrier protein